MSYSIQQASEITGLSAYTLRYYEKEGLFPLINRDKSGKRIFTDIDIAWMGLVRCLRETGMSIGDIRNFAELSRQNDDTTDARRAILEHHRERLLMQMDDLQKSLEKIDCKLNCFGSADKSGGKLLKKAQ